LRQRPREKRGEVDTSIKEAAMNIVMQMSAIDFRADEAVRAQLSIASNAAAKYKQASAKSDL
jgi:hypothetical protein